ncbi:hypothetical protein [Clostridium sp. C2-6-12]|uniref:hypothetical protein n=1 Tax=Clostridium sp. C2-6-12 TaxID=2698832 RepID=UPI00136964D4|nr:hypothetical protein [Clostridium sp. C2-6-12]
MDKLEYEVKYPQLSVSKLVKNRGEFDYEIIKAYVSEYGKGFKVKEVGKTHRSGTIFTYEKIKETEEIEEYKKTVIELIKKYNNQYDSHINIESFFDKL